MAEIRINLNESVKFKLTDHGKDIYYHRHDDLIKFLRKKGINTDGLQNYPSVDKDGYSETQLWSFMTTYGPKMYMGAPIVVEPLEIVYTIPEDSDLVEVTKCKDCSCSKEIDNVLYCTYFNKNVDANDFCSNGG